MLRVNYRYISALLSGISYFWLTGTTSAALLNLPDVPLLVDGDKTALVQLVVQRDNNLFFEAYPTYEDINSDGVLDTHYKPQEIDYFGYFEPDFCYSHDNDQFKASSFATNKKCLSDASSWSGDFLNYMTMTRMDIMSGALYGGQRIIDTSTQTVLRRAFVPWDIHTWGIEYISESENGYKISDYSSLNEPESGKRHLLATNNSVTFDDIPYLRIRENSDNELSSWVDIEGEQGVGAADFNLPIDVEVCADGFLESVCRQYPNGNYKPVGLLHAYGENNSMYFSLLTGSYENNQQGGVLRKSMSSFTDEVNSDTGQFTSIDGIVKTLDAIEIPNTFNNPPDIYYQDCTIRSRTYQNGECKSWGNPIAEMMYEGMRYLSGAESPTGMFYDDAVTSTSQDTSLGLPAATWDNPYSPNQPYDQCSSAYQLVISDSSPTFDGDQLPGSNFSTFTDSALGALHVGNLADFISDNEAGLPGLKFIGESNGISDRAPTVKMVTTFDTIRGISPDGSHRQGSYYAPSVSYFGHQNDLQADVPGDQTVSNFILSLGSPIPTIEVDVDGSTVSFAPFSKSVGTEAGGTSSAFNYTLTNPIVGFIVEDYSSGSGSILVNYEAAEHGEDNDMDATVRYEYEVANGEVEMTVTSVSAAATTLQHLGYVVSGTTSDGVYLVVRDADVAAGRDIDDELDVPPGEIAGSANWNDGEDLPLVSTISFTPTSIPAAQTLESPLWYAAKWGGFEDTNDDGIPQQSEWDSDGDGDPDNYFEVSEPSRLLETLGNVFSSISVANGNVAAVSVTGSSLSNDSQIYESSFQTGTWYGTLTSRGINTDGTLDDNIDWDVNIALTEQITNDTRTILTYKPSTESGIAFRWPAISSSPTVNELDPEQISALSMNPVTDESDSLGGSRLDYLRGNTVTAFRQRARPLGDIVNSAAQLVGPPSAFYPDDWGEDEPESDSPYSEFAIDNAQRQRVVYVGANDGMLHAFDAGELDDGSYDTGEGSEIFAYVPAKVIDKLPELTDPDYTHEFYVDATPTVADVFIEDEWKSVLVGGLGRGGQGIYALDITDVDSVSEEEPGATVLWEFTDEDDAHLGYTYTSPLITRMHDGSWAAVFGSGYNALEDDGYKASDGLAAIFIVDIASGDLIRKLYSSDGSLANPNGINAPTAVDLDNDNIVDVIYAGDLHGAITKYDVTSSDPDEWSRIGGKLFSTVPRDEAQTGSFSMPVTSRIAVGSHPRGDGIMLYFASGQYLEPSDLSNNGDLHRFYGLWDEDPTEISDLTTEFLQNRLLEQTITAEKTVTFDTDGDDIADSSASIRESSQHEIDWDTDSGWYIDLEYNNSSTGERVIANPSLREGRVVFGTYIPTGNECVPDSSGWLMILDAASGAMPVTSIDLNGDSAFATPGETISGVRTLNNPFAAPTIVATNNEDVILTSDPDGGGTTGTLLDSIGLRGRTSWRELDP